MDGVPRKSEPLIFGYLGENSYSLVSIAQNGGISCLRGIPAIQKNTYLKSTRILLALSIVASLAGFCLGVSISSRNACASSRFNSTTYEMGFATFTTMF